MKFNKLAAAIIWATTVSGVAQNNVGTLVTDPIRPFSVNSTNPSAIANEIKGGPFVSSNLAGLSNIPAPRLEIGAIGYATNTGLYYSLTSISPATWSSINGVNFTNIAASNIVGTLAITNGGTGATNIDQARENLGLGTNSPATFARISLTASGGTNLLALQFETNNTGFYVSGSLSTGPWVFVQNGSVAFAVLTNQNAFYRPLSFLSNSAPATRTNLGLGWEALTNTSPVTFQAALFGSGTNPVLVNTNGEVVSPTNFWQVAPIVTRFVEFDPATNATTNIVAARNLHIHSLAISRTGVTSTIALPTNGAFNGDIALVVHQGPTSSVTAVRTAGAGTNLVTFNQFDEAVEFVYYNNVWQFNHNRSFIEPIYFSGTNAAANAAASRTNLGLGATWLTNTNVTNFRSAIGLGANVVVSFFELDAFKLSHNGEPILDLEDKTLFDGLGSDSENVVFSFAGTDFALWRPLNFDGPDAQAAANITRTNLGLGLPALTNTSNVTFQSAVFTTNTAPTNAANVNSVGFNTVVKWMEITLNIGGTNQVFRIPLFQ
jgi:hypothetical protein